MNYKPKQDVLNYLFQNQSASRIQISRGLKMRPGTVGEVCDNLIRGKHICPMDSDRQRNVRLKVNPEKYQAIGVEHVAEGLIAVILSADLSVKLQERIVIPEALDGQERLQKIVAEIDRLIRKPRSRAAIIALGFCDIGMLDASTGRSIRAEFLPGWNDMPVREKLETKLKIPVSLSGKTDAWCAGERKFGAAKEWETFICVLVDRGIGLALMSGGKLIHGNHPVFGELGHVVCDPSGDICKCGSRGCLETIAGTDAIVGKVRAHLTAVDEQEFGIRAGELTIENVIQAAQKGHKLAEMALQEAARAIGLVLARILTVLGITNIVFSGRLTTAGELFIEPLRRSLRQYCIYPLNTNLKIVVGSWDEWLGARGAAYSVLEKYFRGAEIGEKKS